MGEVTNIEMRHNVGAELRAVVEAEGRPATVAGYAAVFDKPSFPLSAGGRKFIEIIRPGAFRNSLAEGKEVKADIGHSRERVIGRRSRGTLTLVEDQTGLLVSIIPGNDSDGRDVVEKLKRGDVDQMSFEFRVRPGGEQWQRQQDGTYLRYLTDVDVLRVTVTADPAYGDTSVAVRSLEAVIANEEKDIKHEPVPADYFRIKLAKIKTTESA